MENFKNRINSLNTCKFIFISSILAYISTIPFSIIASYINYDPSENINVNLPLMENIAIIIFLGPLIESILIIIITEFVGKLFKKSIKITVFISSIIFSSLHMYSLIYALALIIPSFIFISSYFLYCNKSNYFNSFFIMTTIHILYNSYNLLFSLII